MLKRGQWSVEDLTKLREHFGRRPIGQLARELRRTPATVFQRARLLFSGQSRSGDWQAGEITELRRMVGIADVDTMALVLGRSPGEVLDTLRSWGGSRTRGRFQIWETEYLKTCYASRPDWAVVLVMRRSLSVIRRRARELCLGKDRRIEAVDLPELEKLVTIAPQPPIRMPRWTDGEVERLATLYSSSSNLDLAKELGRSVKSVIAKANELGLRKSAERLRIMGRENVHLRHKKGR